MLTRLITICLFAIIGVVGASAADRLVVVELFTSQGCSSCPPADAVLRRIAARPDVLALSLPVTYWDKDGWKDTLARPQNTEKQRAYAAAMGSAQVYTPQIVVDGAHEGVGSDEHAVLGMITADKAAGQSDAIKLSASIGKVGWHVHAEGVDGADIHVISYRPEATVKIGAGENEGEAITYTNVIVSDQTFGTAGPAQTSFDVGAMDMNSGLRWAIIAQRGDAGPILAAAKVDLKAPRS